MALTNPALAIKPALNREASKVNGIFAPDIVIANMLNKGLADLRLNPWELDLVFAYLKEQPELGDKEAKRATEWFLKTNIPVQWNLSLRPENLPAISYALMGGDIQEQTLGDINYDTHENKKAEWEPITPKFTPSYNAATGLVTIPATIVDQYSLNDSMVMVNYDGVYYPLTNYEDGNFSIGTNLMVLLKNCIVRRNDSRLVSNIEGVECKEIIRIGVHAINDPITCIWLFSIAKYILLKYNRCLLEARGFECLNWSYGPYDRDPILGPENVTTRIITITGKCRDYWASYQSVRAEDVLTDFQVSPIGTETDSSSEFGAEPNTVNLGYEALLEQDPYGR